MPNFIFTTCPIKKIKWMETRKQHGGGGDRTGRCLQRLAGSREKRTTPLYEEDAGKKAASGCVSRASSEEAADKEEGGACGWGRKLGYEMGDGELGQR